MIPNTVVFVLLFLFTWQKVQVLVLLKVLVLVLLGRGLAVESTSYNPLGPGSNPRLGSRRSSLICPDHAELLSSTPSLVLCCAWLVTMTLHVHCGLGQLSPLPTSGDDEWVAAKALPTGKAEQNTKWHPPVAVKPTVPFHYINNQSLLFTFTSTVTIVLPDTLGRFFYLIAYGSLEEPLKN